MNESLSIVLPVYNEENNIAETIFQLDNVMKKTERDYEIIVIESGSTDNSGKIADDLAKKYKNLKVFHQGIKKGYGNGIREGFLRAKKKLIMFTDPDRPFNFNDLPNYLQAINGYDALIGHRKNKKIPFLRKFYSLGFKLANRLFFGIKNIKDINFSLKIIKKDMLDRLNLTADGWYINADIIMGLIKNNAKINQIPVAYTLRGKGKSNVSFKTIFSIIKEMYYYKKKNEKNSFNQPTAAQIN